MVFLKTVIIETVLIRFYYLRTNSKNIRVPQPNYNSHVIHIPGGKQKSNFQIRYITFCLRQ